MIVVTTPAGQIGRQVLDLILDSGEPVRVIARDPSRLSPHARASAEIVQGSHGDADTVTKAFAGADRVFWLVPPDARHPGGTERHYLDFTRPACDAIKSQAVRQVVGVSTLGHGYRGKAGILSAALAMDKLIEDTGVDYRALAMPFFMENLLRQARAIKDQGTFFLANPADQPLPTAATRDVAFRAAALLLDRSWAGQASVPVVGPDNLTPVGMAQVMSDALGLTVRFQQIPVAAYKAMMLQHGASEAVAQDMADAIGATSNGIYDTEPRDRHAAAPTSFRQWCQDVLRPAIQA
jgi:uncharacterized protein YbjT (DUF2867 family)